MLFRSTSTISDFGADALLSVFQVILAIIAVSVLWVKKKEYKALYLSLLVFFVLSAYFKILLMFLGFFVSYLASYTLILIQKKKWELPQLKTLTAMLIIYGVLFSAISFEMRIVNSPPSADEADALLFLGAQAGGMVLTHPSNGYFVQYFGKKPVLIDGRFGFLRGSEAVLEDTKEIFSSRNLQQTEETLAKYNVSYVYINREMKEGLVWEKRDEGLLFLLDHSDSFENIYFLRGVEIWKVLNATT